MRCGDNSHRPVVPGTRDNGPLTLEYFFGKNRLDIQLITDNNKSYN